MYGTGNEHHGYLSGCLGSDSVLQLEMCPVCWENEAPFAWVRKPHHEEQVTVRPVLQLGTFLGEVSFTFFLLSMENTGTETLPNLPPAWSVFVVAVPGRQS